MHIKKTCLFLLHPSENKPKNYDRNGITQNLIFGYASIPIIHSLLRDIIY